MNRSTSIMGMLSIILVLSLMVGSASAAANTACNGKGCYLGNPPITIVLNQTISNQVGTATANVAAGETPSIFVWRINGNLTNYSTQTTPLLSSLIKNGTNNVSVRVNDANHDGPQVYSVIFNYSSYNATPYRIGTLTIPNSILPVGQSENVIINITTILPLKPSTYNWLINGNPAADNTPSIIFHGNASDLGSDKVSVLVTGRFGIIHEIANGIIDVVSNTTTIGPISVPNIIIANLHLTVGQNETATANVIGGKAPYAFVWKLNGDIIGSNSPTITIHANQSDIGSDNVSVRVTDSMGNFASGTATIIINGTTSKGGLEIPNGAIEIGQIESIGISNTLGLNAPYTYSWKVNGNSLSQGASSIIFHGNISDLGINNLSVTVTGRAGAKIMANGTITVYNNLTNAVSISLPSTSMVVGQNQTLTANVLGGVAPFTYYWTLNGNALIQSGRSIILYANSSDIGTQTVRVSVGDATGATGFASSNVIVAQQSPNSPPQTTSTVGQSSGVGGGAFTGGLPPITIKTTYVTTVVPSGGSGVITTTIPIQSNVTTITTANKSGTPRSTTATTGGTLPPASSISGSRLPSQSSSLLLVIIVLLAIILALLYELDKRGAASAATKRKKKDEEIWSEREE